MQMDHAITLGRVSAPDVAVGFASQARERKADPYIRDDNDGGLVTIAGTGTGKGVSQVIPTALTYPGSMVIVDVKGEIAAVSARARRQMGQEVVVLDPFGAQTAALNPMEAINPARPDAFDICKRLAGMMRGRGGIRTDPFWDDMAEMIISGSLLFLALHIARKDRALPLLYRMWGVADRLEEMLVAMQSCHLHNGVVAGAAKAYVDSPDKTRGSILSSIRNHIGFLASSSAKKSLEGGWGLLSRIREAQPMTIYIRVPPSMLTSQAALMRLWLGVILSTVSERAVRPDIPDLFLVDEAATLGYLDELLSASSLLRGYGLRTWTFWQSIGQIESIYGSRASEFLDNASVLSMFGASNAASAQALETLTGYTGPILGMPKVQQVLCVQGNLPIVSEKLNYLNDPTYRGLFDANPFHAAKPARPFKEREVI